MKGGFFENCGLVSISMGQMERMMMGYWRNAFTRKGYIFLMGMEALEVGTVGQVR